MFIEIAIGNLLYDSGNSNLEGWEWAGAGRESQEGGDISTPMANLH